LGILALVFNRIWDPILIFFYIPKKIESYLLYAYNISFGIAALQSEAIY